MGLFSKNKNKEFEDGHNEFLFSDEDDYIRPLQDRSRFGDRKAAPHAITADELSGSHVETIPMRSEAKPKTSSVYESMREHQRTPENSGFDDTYVPSWVSGGSHSADISAFSDRPKAKSSAEETADAAKRAEAILKNTDVRSEKAPVIKAEEPKTIEMITTVEQESENRSVTVSKKAESESATSFLERCRKAVLGSASEKDNTTVEEIPMVISEEPKPADVKEENPHEDFESILRKLKGEKTDELEPEVHTEPQQEEKAEEKSEEPVVTEEVLTEPDIEATVVLTPILKEDVKADKQDDDNTIVLPKIEQNEPSETKVADEATDATIMFSGLDDIISQKADDSFTVSREIYEDEYDEDEEDEVPEIPYYETEDRDLDGIDDYKDLNDAARLRIEMQDIRSKNSAKTTVSFLITAVMLVMSLPFVDNVSSVAMGIINLLLLGGVIGVNLDIFKGFLKLAGKPDFDCCAALVAVVAVVQTVVASFVYNGAFASLAGAAGLLLAVNRAVKLSKAKRIDMGLEKIATSEPKKVLNISQENAAKVMASGAVEGEVVSVSVKETVNVQGFMKNSMYKSPFDLKVKTLFYVGLFVSLFAGLIVGAFSGFGAGITVGTAMLCCCYPVSAVISSEMPFSRIASYLAQYGGVIAGFRGAYNLNLSNVVALNTSDIFPAGSVKLYNMKTLGQNEIGQTLTAAAAVAIAADSPLASIFRDMVGVSSENQLPKVNGVQYEDKMGISGWIGDNTVLIGNRNLMQGHNIPVPPASVDQKILKAGYFPVYIACKGVPCLLFVVKYEVDPTVKKELCRLCNTGMTVVVNPQDPNASDTMICDYFGLPDDALKLMNHNGRVMYQRQTAAQESIEAPAVCGRSALGTMAAITASINLKTTLAIMTAIYIIAAILGGVLLIYLCALGKMSLITSVIVSMFQLVFMLISVIALKVKDRR